MKLNIIHLKERKDRWQSLMSQLDEQGITDFEIWDGVIDNERPPRGIYKAHKRIVEYAIKNEMKSILIAEDDLKFTAPGAFEYFRMSIPIEFDLFLGGIMHGEITDNCVADFSGAHLYIIHERFYEAFLSLPELVDFDRALANKGRFVVCNPMVAFQLDGYSDDKKKFQAYTHHTKNRNAFKLNQN